MAFTYCKHCGHKNLYSLVTPKFCGSCGGLISGEGPEAKAAEAPILKERKTSTTLREKAAALSESASLERDSAPRPSSSENAPRAGTKDLNRVFDETDIDHVPNIGTLKHSVINADSLGGNVIKLSELISADSIPETKDVKRSAISPEGVARLPDDPDSGPARASLEGLQLNEEEALAPRRRRDCGFHGELKINKDETG